MHVTTSDGNSCSIHVRRQYVLKYRCTEKINMSVLRKHISFRNEEISLRKANIYSECKLQAKLAALHHLTAFLQQNVVLVSDFFHKQDQRFES